MRTTIIPAQITTVEDKIAGSLNLTQILILMFPVLWTSLVYALFVPSMKLVPYKMILIVTASVVSVGLAIRIKEKIVAEWLGVLIRYQQRPHYYLFNKNDNTNRIVDIPELPKELTHTKQVIKMVVKKPTLDISVSDLAKFEHLVRSGKVAVRYQFGRKV